MEGVRYNITKASRRIRGVFKTLFSQKAPSRMLGRVVNAPLTFLQLRNLIYGHLGIKYRICEIKKIYLILHEAFKNSRSFLLFM